MKALFLLLAVVLSAMALGQGFDEARSDLYSASIKVAVKRAKGTSHLSDIDLLPNERIVVLEEGSTYTRVIVVADETADRAALERTLRTWHVAPDGVKMETLGGELVAESWRVRGRFPNTSAERKVELPDVHATFAPPGGKAWAYVAIPDHGRVGPGEAERGFFVRELQAGETPTFTVSASLHPGAWAMWIGSLLLPALLTVLFGRRALAVAKVTRPVPRWCLESLGSINTIGSTFGMGLALFLSEVWFGSFVVVDLWGFCEAGPVVLVAFAILPSLLLSSLAGRGFARAIKSEIEASRANSMEGVSSFFAAARKPDDLRSLWPLIGLAIGLVVLFVATGAYQSSTLRGLGMMAGMSIAIMIYVRIREARTPDPEHEQWETVPELVELVEVANLGGKKVRTITIAEPSLEQTSLLPSVFDSHMYLSRRMLLECSPSEQRVAVAFGALQMDPSILLYLLMGFCVVVCFIAGFWVFALTWSEPGVGFVVGLAVGIAVCVLINKKMRVDPVQTWKKAAALVGDPEAPVFLLRKQIEEESNPRRRAALERTLADYQASLPTIAIPAEASSGIDRDEPETTHARSDS